MKCFYLLMKYINDIKIKWTERQNPWRLIAMTGRGGLTIVGRYPNEDEAFKALRNYEIEHPDTDCLVRNW